MPHLTSMMRLKIITPQVLIYKTELTKELTNWSSRMKWIEMMPYLKLWKNLWEKMKSLSKCF